MRGKYSGLFEQAPVGLVILDTDNVILEANPAAGRLLKADSRDLTGKPLARYIAPASQDTYYEHRMEFFSSGDSASCEVYMNREDGTRFLAQLRSSLLAGKEANRHLLAFVDLAGRHNRRLLESHKSLFEAVIAQAADGIVVRDAAGRVIVANAAARHESVIDLVGTAYDVAPQVWGEVYDAGGRRVPVEEWPSSLALKGDTTRREVLVVRPDGRRQNVLISASPIRLDDGAIAGSVTVLTDITERKQADEVREQLIEEVGDLARALADENQLLSVVMDNTRTMLVYFDRDFKFIEANPVYTRFTGYKERELIGKDFFSLFPGKKREAVFRQVAETGITAEFREAPFLDPNHPERGITYWDGALVPVKDESGRVRGLVLSLVEATARKAAQARQSERDRLAALGELSGNISHELRNPLATIDSSVFYLKSRLSAQADEKVLAHLDRIKSSVDRCIANIQGLLNLARVKELQLGRVDLAKLVQDTLSGSTMPSGVKVVQEICSDAVAIDGDTEQLRMAFGNIIANAVEAMEARGTLTVTLSHNGKHAFVSFRDTGPGIPPENLKHLFSPLFTTKITGFGFGLSMTRAIIEKHGGTVAACSGSEGGATITMSLPIS